MLAAAGYWTISPARATGGRRWLAAAATVDVAAELGNLRVAHRLVALVEIVSPANKDRPPTVEEFIAKAVDALDVGIHVLLVDLLPPGPCDPQGMQGRVYQRLEQSDEPYDLPADAPLTLASYAAGPQIEVYLEHLAVGAILPEMPLFLRHDRYVNVPLEATYQEAYRGMPAFWRNVLEGGEPNAP